MKIDFNQLITDLDGQPIKENGKDITLGMMACNAIMFPVQPPESITGDETVKRMGMALRIKAGQKDNLLIEMDAEDVVLVNSQIVKMTNQGLHPLVCARVLMAMKNDNHS